MNSDRAPASKLARFVPTSVLESSVGNLRPPTEAIPEPTDDVSEHLLAYIPAGIHQRLAAGQSAWLGEMHRITVLFVNLPDVRADTPVETMQRAMRSIQDGLYRFEGSVNKLSIDEKGVTLVAAFGLPPFAHEDDAERGVRAALELRARLDKLGWGGLSGSPADGSSAARLAASGAANTPSSAT